MYHTQYHDITAEVDGALSVAYGLCYEPTLGDVSLAAGLFTSASSNPSPGLPWWDKFRYMLHGRLRASVSELSFHLLSTTSPYHENTYVKINTRQLEAIYTAGSLRVKAASARVSRNPARDGEDAYLQLQRLHAHLVLSFECGSGYQFGHYLVPEIHRFPAQGATAEDWKGYDMYRDFRSSAIKLGVHITSGSIAPAPAAAAATDEDLVTYVTLDHLNVPWILRFYQNVLTNTPPHLKLRRRHGIPPKPSTGSFSRVLREVYVNLRVGDTRIEFWEDVEDEPRGLVVDCAAVRFESVARQEPVPPEEAERRHPLLRDSRPQREQTTWKTYCALRLGVHARFRPLTPAHSLHFGNAISHTGSVCVLLSTRRDCRLTQLAQYNVIADVRDVDGQVFTKQGWHEFYAAIAASATSEDQLFLGTPSFRSEQVLIKQTGRLYEDAHVRWAATAGLIEGLSMSSVHYLSPALKAVFPDVSSAMPMPHDPLRGPVDSFMTNVADLGAHVKRLRRDGRDGGYVDCV